MTSTRRLSLPSDFFRGRSKSTAEPYQMTEETLQERIKKVNAGRFFTQAFAGIAGKIKKEKLKEKMLTSYYFIPSFSECFIYIFWYGTRLV